MTAGRRNVPNTCVEVAWIDTLIGKQEREKRIDPNEAGSRVVNGITSRVPRRGCVSLLDDRSDKHLPSEKIHDWKLTT